MAARMAGDIKALSREASSQQIRDAEDVGAVAEQIAKGDVAIADRRAATNRAVIADIERNETDLAKVRIENEMQVLYAAKAAIQARADAARAELPEAIADMRIGPRAFKDAQKEKERAIRQGEAEILRKRQLDENAKKLGWKPSEEDKAFLKAFKKRGELQAIADKAAADIAAIDKERMRLLRAQTQLQQLTLIELKKNLAALNNLIALR
jgi:hypothetical protein